MKIFSLFGAFCRFAGAIGHGNSPFATNRTVELRRGICEHCKYFNPKIRLCEVCFCMIDLKSQLATEECPKGYWSRARLTMFSLTTLFKLNARRLFRR